MGGGGEKINWVVKKYTFISAKFQQSWVQLNGDSKGAVTEISINDLFREDPLVGKGSYPNEE